MIQLIPGWKDKLRPVACASTRTFSVIQSAKRKDSSVRHSQYKVVIADSLNTHQNRALRYSSLHSLGQMLDTLRYQNHSRNGFCMTNHVEWQSSNTAYFDQMALQIESNQDQGKMAAFPSKFRALMVWKHQLNFLLLFHFRTKDPRNQVSVTTIHSLLAHLCQLIIASHRDREQTRPCRQY
jgi:hypothetical protein